MVDQERSAARATIFRVDDDGTTGHWLGTGTLVHDVLVLLHPPLATDLARAEAGRPRLRVGVPYGSETEPAVDVLEVRAVHVARPSVDPQGRPGEPLVFLELAHRSHGGVLDLPSAIPDDPAGIGVQADLRRHLAELSVPGGHVPPLPGGGRPSNIWCWLIPRFCHPGPAAGERP